MTIQQCEGIYAMTRRMRELARQGIKNDATWLAVVAVIARVERVAAREL